MTCPKCNTEARVVDSRPHVQGWRRRRHCINPNCRHRFSSIEKVVETLEPHEIVSVAGALVDLNTSREALARAHQALLLVLKDDS